MDTTKTHESALATDDRTIVTKSGRVFRPYHKKLLDMLPPDMVREIARRKIEEIREEERRRETGSTAEASGSGDPGN